MLSLSAKSKSALGAVGRLWWCADCATSGESRWAGCGTLPTLGICVSFLWLRARRCGSLPLTARAESFVVGSSLCILGSEIWSPFLKPGCRTSLFLCLNWWSSVLLPLVGQVRCWWKSGMTCWNLLLLLEWHLDVYSGSHWAHLLEVECKRPWQWSLWAHRADKMVGTLWSAALG